MRPQILGIIRVSLLGKKRNHPGNEVVSSSFGLATNQMLLVSRVRFELTTP